MTMNYYCLECKERVEAENTVDAVCPKCKEYNTLLSSVECIKCHKESFVMTDDPYCGISKFICHECV